MQKLTGHAALKKDGVYNRIYTGDNAAFARINGKETFLVLETTPKLQIVALFDQYGDPYTQYIVGGVITINNLELAFQDFDLFEPVDGSEWLKKSMKFDSLSAPLEKGLITREQIENVAQWRGHCPFMSSSGVGGKLRGVQCGFNVEGKTGPTPPKDIHCVADLASVDSRLQRTRHQGAHVTRNISRGASQFRGAPIFLPSGQLQCLKVARGIFVREPKPFSRIRK